MGIRRGGLEHQHVDDRLINYRILVPGISAQDYCRIKITNQKIMVKLLKACDDMTCHDPTVFIQHLRMRIIKWVYKINYNAEVASH